MKSPDADLRNGGNPRLGWPTLAVTFSTLFWGTAWLPMRLLKERGLDAVSAVLLLFLIVTIVLTPTIYLNRMQMVLDRRSVAIAGLTGGTSMTCYYLSVTMTSIAHATLLFYLTPIWAILIERVALKKRLQPISFIEVALGLAGLLVILGPSLLSVTTINLGDALAFVAGVSFAVSSFYMYSAPGPGATGYTWAWAAGSTLSAGIIALLFDAGGIARAIAIPGAAASIFIPVLVFALCIFMPMNMLTLWGARLLSPTRVSLLLMCEVAVAFGSSAIIAHDPFGLREAIGCCLIIGSALIRPIAGLLPSKSASLAATPP